jgi:hypothetical protein
MDIGTAVSAKLAPRLQLLPLVIAGPILRRVTDSSVTVWVALQKSASVTIQILSGISGTSETVGSPATQSTVAVGRFLHIVAVTVQASLIPGVVYRYNLTFTVFDSAGHKIGDVPLLAAVTPTAVPNPISYPPYDLPSFSLPPKELNDLRIIHGSCRMPHGNGPDALSLLDELIRVTVKNAAKRPHQLLLNGDQIYADDVSAALLLQIMDASNTLLGTDTTAPFGWRSEEKLPVAPPYALGDRPSDYPPLTRTLLLGRGGEGSYTDVPGAGFTSADLRNHLMALGEYLCLYLFTWSDVLWPPSDSLPTADAITALARAAPVSGPGRGLLSGSPSKKDINSIPGDTKDVLVHRKTLPRVRRALANIPTYMIFDDHDVTDDWNMSLDFVSLVYANDLGLRIVQNALVAYALCQLWGNVPEQFQNDASGKPAAGRQLLNLLENKTSLDYDANSAALQKLVGVHDLKQIKARQIKTGAPEAVFHDQDNWVTIGGVQVSTDSLVYNFTYTGPSHQIVVTDTRSWRSYRLGDDASPDLLPPDQIAAQIPLTPALGDRVLMIVLTTNAPPVQPIRGATRHDTLSNTLSAWFTPDSYPDLYEAWEIPSLGFDRLLTRICEKFKPNQTGYAVLMSGDVHFSFATRIVYDASNPYGATTPQTVRAVVAQLVASPCKKQDDDTVGFQRDGYFYVPHSVERALIKKDMSEGYVGWNVAPNASFRGGTVEQWRSGRFPGYVSHPIREITNTDPTLQIYPRPSDYDVPARILLDRKPDYRYRLDYLRPESQFTQPNPTVTPIGPMPASGATSEERAQAMTAFNNATGHYREHNRNPGNNSLIGRNNLCEVTFDWGAKDSSGDHKTVNHTVRWRKNGKLPDDPAPDPDLPNTTVWWTNYAVSLDPNAVSLGPNNPNYQDYKADKEGP